MLKKIICSVSIITIAIIGYGTFMYWSQPALCGNSEKSFTIDSSKPRILLVCLAQGFGGAETHMIKLYQLLLKHQYRVKILVSTNSATAKQLATLNLPHYTTIAGKFKGLLRPLYHLILKQCYKSIFTQEQFDIIHCNNRPEVADIKAVKKSHPVRVILTQHTPDTKHVGGFEHIDILSVVSPRMITIFDNIKKQHNFNIQEITFTPPLFDREKFLSFTPPPQSRDVFFKTLIKNTFKPLPVICMLANFYGDLDHKNHPLMIKAVKRLVDMQKPVYIFFAGDGPSRPMMEKMVSDYGLEEYVHFLGFYNNTPTLLYYSDMMVLSSKKEGLPLVFSEAGLMKKPSIGAMGSGAEAIIVDQHTGLLFTNDNLDDLVNKIETLIDKPAYGRQLGENAYHHVINTFAPDIIFDQYAALYEHIR